MMIRVLALFLIMTSTTVAVDWERRPNSTHDVTVRDAGGELQISTTGSDPYLTGRLREPISAKDRVLEIEYFSTTGITDFSTIIGPPINESRRVNLPSIPIAEGWQKYKVDLVARLGTPIPADARLLRFDFGMRPDAVIRIRSVRLRKRTAQEAAAAKNAAEKRKAKAQLSQRIRAYLSRESNSKTDPIESVAVEKTHISIRLKSPANATVSLREFRPQHRLSSNGIVVGELEKSADGKTLRLPRVDGNYDRVLSAWQIDSEDPTQTWHYPTSFDIGKGRLRRITPRNQKGLSGLSKRGPQQDFVDLDISSATVNLVLSRFVTNRPGAARVKIPCGKHDVYFDPAPFAHYDQIIGFAHQHDIVVSAIVLIPSPKGSHRSPLVHPETDGGTYAMPDLTTSSSAAVYAFVLNEIAKRYSAKSDSPGVISNWIAHNEIDFHTVWTNMGRQPREVVTDTYYRSMRLIHNLARQYNPHARVFVSLTHHWNVEDDGSWQRLSPREVLTDLQRYSNLDGDFAWGVAYHPYPQSLFARVAWKDRKVSDNFETPLITMQNLQVLGRFLKQPSMHASDGSARPVILSEQGFHTDSYDEEAQDRQAASLWWAMRRLKEMPWVESFIYHRWIDHPQEGGLLLGLRTLPNKGHPHGRKKRSWRVYQAIGTNREAAETADLPTP